MRMPDWFNRLSLFFGILWRMHEGQRMSASLSWGVAKCLYPTGSARGCTKGFRR